MVYRKKNQLAIRSKRTVARRRAPAKPKYRNVVARVARPMSLQPKSVIQKLVYYNTFKCVPSLAEDGTQQIWGFKFHLNSPWLFGPNWNALAQDGFSQQIVPNDPIQPLEVSGTPFANTTVMPGLIDGADAYSKFANGVVTGSKTTFTASPLTNAGTDNLQLGYLVCRKHSNVNDVPHATTISDLKKYPYLQMRKLQAGPQITSNGKHIEARITVRHSPKHFNNVKDYRDNPQLAFKTNTSIVDAIGVVPSEKDILSVYCVGALNNLTPEGQTTRAKATNFMLTMRHEVNVLMTEPVTDTSNPTNYSMYRAANNYGSSGFANGISKYLSAGRYY